MPSTVLCVLPGRNNRRIAHLVTAQGHVQGDLGELRALAARLKARGPTLLILPSHTRGMDPSKAIPDLKDPQLLAYLASLMGGAAAISGRRPLETASIMDQDLLAQTQAAAKHAGLTLTQLLPLTSAALLAAPGRPDVVLAVIYDRQIALTTVSGNEVLSRDALPVQSETQANNLITGALTRVRSNNLDPQLILVSDDPVPPGDHDGQTVLTVADLLRWHLNNPDLPAVASADLAKLPMRIDIEHHRASLRSRPGVDPVLIGTLALTGAIIAGGYTYGVVLRGQVSALQAQEAALQVQADEVVALRSENDGLQARVEQARALTAAKGFLHVDLPVIAERVLETGARLQSLTGPSPATSADTAMFGQPVTRAYEIAAAVRDVAAFTQAFGERGLTADVRSVTCAAGPCTVTLRVAPTQNVPTVPRSPSAASSATPGAPTMSTGPGGGP